MQSQIQQKLKAIIVEHGTSIVNDPRRIKAMLKDLFPQNKREVRVLSAVLDEGFAKRLLRDGDKIPTSISIPQYAQILHDDLAIDLAMSRWAVETWAMALSLKIPQATPAPTLPPTQAPTPEPTPKPTVMPTPAPTPQPTQKPTPTTQVNKKPWLFLLLLLISVIIGSIAVGGVWYQQEQEKQREQKARLTALAGTEPTDTWMHRLWDWADKYNISNDNIPRTSAKLTKLTRLYLNNNQLTSLPPEIGKLTNLTELYLNNNQLTSLPPEIGKLTNLKDLTLWRNQLLPTSEIDKVKRLLPNCEVDYTVDY
jgi:hypothetical protein